MKRTSNHQLTLKPQDLMILLKLVSLGAKPPKYGLYGPTRRANSVASASIALPDCAGGSAVKTHPFADGSLAAAC
jgi:hypothetical protein